MPNSVFPVHVNSAKSVIVLIGWQTDYQQWKSVIVNWLVSDLLLVTICCKLSDVL